MSLPDSGEIGLKQIAELFEDDGDHSLSEFYQKEPVITDRLTASGVLNNWSHYGIGSTGFVPEADLSEWTAPNGNTLRSTNNVGHIDMLVSPAAPVPAGYDKFNYVGFLEGRYDDYDLEVVFSSDGPDDDRLGVLISGEFDANTGEFGRLIAMRGMGGGMTNPDNLFVINYQDDTTNGSIDIFKAGVNEGLTAQLLDSGDPNNQGWITHGPVRLLVSRRRDYVHVWISNSDDSDWVLSKTIDLRDLPALTGSSKAYDYVGGRTAYGFATNSQAGGLITFHRTPAHLPLDVDAGDGNLVATYGKVPTFDFSEDMPVVDGASIFDPNLKDQIPFDGLLTAVTRAERGFLFAADVGQDEARTVNQTAVPDAVASKRWGFSLENKNWFDVKNNIDVNHIGHDRAIQEREAITDGMVGEVSGYTLGLIEWIYARSDKPNSLFLAIGDTVGSSLYGKQVSVDIEGLGRLISDTPVNSDFWQIELVNPSLNVYQFFSNNPDVNLYLGQWESSELNFGFNDVDGLLENGASFSPADGESAVGFETDVGSVDGIPATGMYVNSILSLRENPDIALVVLTGHIDSNIYGRTVTLTIGTLPSQTVVLSDQTVKGTGNILMLPITVAGIFSFLEGNTGTSIDITLNVSPSNASNQIYRYDEYLRRTVEQLTHQAIGSTDDLAMTYNDLIYAVVDENYLASTDLSLDVVECEVTADAVAVDGNDLYILEGLDLRLFRGQAASVGVKTYGNLLGTLDFAGVPATYDKASMVIADEMMYVSLTAGNEVTVVSIAKASANGTGGSWFYLDNVVDVAHSTLEVSGGIFSTPTNVGYLSKDQRSVRYARWNTTKSMPIGLSDFYGYSNRQTYVLNAPEDFDAAERSGPLPLMDLFDAKYGIAIEETRQVYKSTITKRYLPAADYIVNIRPSAANPVIWCKQGWSGSHGLEFDFSGFRIADAWDSVGRDVTIRINVEGDVVGRGGAGGGSMGSTANGGGSPEWDVPYASQSYLDATMSAPQRAQRGGDAIFLPTNLSPSSYQGTGSFKLTLDVSKARLWAGAGGGIGTYDVSYDTMLRLDSNGNVVDSNLNGRGFVSVVGAGGQGGQSAKGVPRGASFGVYGIRPSLSQIPDPYEWKSGVGNVNGYIERSSAMNYDLRYSRTNDAPPYYYSAIGYKQNLKGDPSAYPTPDARAGTHGGIVNSDGTATPGRPATDYSPSTIPSTYDKQYTVRSYELAAGYTRGGTSSNQFFSIGGEPGIKVLSINDIAEQLRPAYEIIL